jgi:hypothetical protein
MKLLVDTHSIQHLKGSNMMEVYTMCGMGDILILRDFLFGAFDESISYCECCGSLLKNYKQSGFANFHIIFRLEALVTRVENNDPTYIEDFLKPFVRILFSDVENLFISFAPDFRAPIPYNVYYEFESDHPNVTEADAYKKINIPDFSNILFRNYNPSLEVLNLIQSKYICISTRYRMFSDVNNNIGFFKKLFYDQIVGTDIKIVLVGENEESFGYQCAHRLLTRIIPSKNLIDFTTGRFFLEDALRDAFLFKHSAFSICFGIGGSYVAGSYVHSNIVGFTDLGENHPFIKKSKTSKIYPEIQSFARDVSLRISQLKK